MEENKEKCLCYAIKEIAGKLEEKIGFPLYYFGPLSIKDTQEIFTELSKDEETKILIDMYYYLFKDYKNFLREKRR